MIACQTKWIVCTVAGLFLALSLNSAEADAAPSLSAETSAPTTSTFTPADPIKLIFSLNDPAKAGQNLQLLLHTEDAFGQTIRDDTYPANLDANGAWTLTVDAPRAGFGFYRVHARLSDGTTVAALGSRRAGEITYCIVPDPAERKDYGQQDTFFGLQGGFNSDVNIIPYLGVRWVLGGYKWDDLEPNHAGELAEKLATDPNAVKDIDRYQAVQEPMVKINGQDVPWKLYTIPSLYSPPDWAIVPGTRGTVAGVLKKEDETAYKNYCTLAAQTYAKNYPDEPEHIYQVTWEPVYPWGFKGTDEQLIRIYQIAYPALHAADPKAVVIGPTGGGIGDVGWSLKLMREGLSHYIDGYSIHPYVTLPPERTDLIQNIRYLREGIQEIVGKQLPLYGTEQGSATNEELARELPQATGLVRTYLIMMGEGFKVNFAFYAADYPGEPGYGFYYNLNPQIAFGTNKTSPKPIVPAFAAMTYLLEGHHTGGPIEGLGYTTAGYAYWRGDDIVLALWDYGDKPEKVSLPVGVTQVQQYDWMGNLATVPTPNGVWEGDLSSSPVYLKGVAASIWGKGAPKQIRLAKEEMAAFPGSTITISGKVTLPKPAISDRSPSKLVFEYGPHVGGGRAEKALQLQPGQSENFSFPLTLAADTALGFYPIKILLEDDQGPLSGTSANLLIKPPLAGLHVAPAFNAKGEPKIDVRMKEATGKAVEGTIETRLEGTPGSRQTAPLKLAPGEERVVGVDLPGIDVSPGRMGTASIDIHLSSGVEMEQDLPVNFWLAPKLAAPPAIDGDLKDWAAIKPVVLDGREWVVRSPAFYKGPDDFAATIRFAWDDHALYAAFEVDEPVFVQDQTGYKTWKGDCVQMDFDVTPEKEIVLTGNTMADAGAVSPVSEIDLALTQNGPESFRTMTPDQTGLPIGPLVESEMPLAIVHQDGKLIYETAIPWRLLGIKGVPKPGTHIGIATAINHMDTSQQTDPTALGIFELKDPAKFGVLILGK